MRSKATWLPPAGKFVFQLFVSIWSYLTLPFFHAKENAIFEFFHKNYYCQPDGFIFDGNNDNNYYSQIEKIYDLKNLENSLVIDLGCGKGALYLWLKKNETTFHQYVGIDFAVRECILSQNACIIQKDMLDFLEYYPKNGQRKMIIMSNSLCYISNQDFVKILNHCNLLDEVIIVEPSRNLFWDAHFDGIKPTYRKLKDIMHILRNNGWIIDSVSSDFMIQIFGICWFRISYSLRATKNASGIGNMYISGEESNVGFQENDNS